MWIKSEKLGQLFHIFLTSIYLGFEELYQTFPQDPHSLLLLLTY